jgi:hypothetical protein
MGQKRKAIRRQIKTRKTANKMEKQNPDWTRKEEGNIIQGQTGI